MFFFIFKLLVLLLAIIAIYGLLMSLKKNTSKKVEDPSDKSDENNWDDF